MSENKQTFVDPETGEEIASTWLAQWVTGPITGLIGGLVIGLFLGLVYGLDYGLGHGMVYGLAPVVLIPMVAGLYRALVPTNMEMVRNDFVIRWAHDRIARYQHRQRVLRSQDDQQVPDTAISRAQPPGEPVPTDAALSIADDHDTPSRLTVSGDTAETVVDNST